MYSTGWLVVALCVLFQIANLGLWTGMITGSLLVVSLVVHEIGHIMAATALGVRVREFGICAFGAYTRRARSGSRWKEILIALSGPLMSLLLVAPSMFLPSHGIRYQLVLANLELFAVNLLPLPASDGLRIVRTFFTSYRVAGADRALNTQKS
jgi:stage IV sporulation protein FB